MPYKLIKHIELLTVFYHFTDNTMRYPWNIYIKYFHKTYIAKVQDNHPLYNVYTINTHMLFEIW